MDVYNKECGEELTRKMLRMIFGPVVEQGTGPSGRAV